MFINTLILAISSSIDSLGIGITYGLRKTKISIFSKFILFITSLIITSISAIIGTILKNIISAFIVELIGSILLIGMGIFIIVQTNDKEFSFDFDNSNEIDYKEAFALAIALSLDSLCIGICGSAIGINIIAFSILVALLQYLFLSIGNICGMHLTKLKFVPQSLWTKISGLLLILIGFWRLFM